MTVKSELGETKESDADEEEEEDSNDCEIRQIEIKSENSSQDFEKLTNFIVNQKYLINKIHNQQKRFKTYQHCTNLSSSNSSAIASTTCPWYDSFSLNMCPCLFKSIIASNEQEMKHYRELLMSFNNTNASAANLATIGADVHHAPKIFSSHSSSLWNNNNYENNKFTSHHNFETKNNHHHQNHNLNFAGQRPTYEKLLNKMNEKDELRPNRYSYVSRSFREVNGSESDQLNLNNGKSSDRCFSIDRSVSRKNEETKRCDSCDVTKKQLTSLYQNLKNQLEDVRIQLKLANERQKTLESDNATKNDKLNSYLSQIENLKKELTLNKDSYQIMKQTYDEQIRNHLNKEKKNEEEIRELEDSLRKLSNTQFESYHRKLEQQHQQHTNERFKSCGHDDLIRQVNEQKSKEIEKLKEELSNERDKFMREHDARIQLEKKLEYINDEKLIAWSREKESLRCESEKMKNEIFTEKYLEISRYLKIINELEDEIKRLKIEEKKREEKCRQFMSSVEKCEKSLIKELNDEQRKLSSIIPGYSLKLNNFSNFKTVSHSLDDNFRLEKFEKSFANLKEVNEEVIKSYGQLKKDQEKAMKHVTEITLEKENTIEQIKRQYEKSKQKELEAIRNQILNENSKENYTNEVTNLLGALRNKEKEIREIQDNMNEWKKDTLSKLAEKFQVELSKELDKRLDIQKQESNAQQAQLDRIQREIDKLSTDFSSLNSKKCEENSEKMVKYLQSRLNDLRDENLKLREKFRSTNYMQQLNSESDLNLNNLSSLMNGSASGSNKTALPNENNPENINSNNNNNNNKSNLSSFRDGVFTNDDEQLVSKNELLKQKLNELQILQKQLISFQT